MHINGKVLRTLPIIALISFAQREIYARNELIR